MLDHFNWLAPFYDRVIAPPDVGRLSQLLNLPTSGRLLDAGGGTCRVSSHLRPLVGELVLTDVSLGMLQQAREKGDLSPSMTHAEALPFPNASFERVLVVDALHHFCDQQLAIAELMRVLKPGGRLVIEEPDLAHRRVKFIALTEKIALMHSHFYYPEEIGDMAVAHGASIHINRDSQISAWILVDK